MKSDDHIAVYENRQRLPGMICDFPETISLIYNNLLTDCAMALYIWGSHLQNDYKSFFIQDWNNQWTNLPRPATAPWAQETVKDQ